MFPEIRKAARRLELVARLTETWFMRPRAPTRLVMDVTRRCNLRCETCRTWRVAPGHELSPDEIRATLGRMPRLLWLDVTGGEPFLRADAGEIFDAILDAAPRLRVLHFPTNGWFERRVVDVVRRSVERRSDLDVIVTVSIDGPPAVHDRLRGRAGSFERAIRTFRALRAVDGCDVYVGTTISPFNEDLLDDLGEELRARVPGFRAREWHWNWLQVSEHFFDNAHLADLPPPRRGHLVRDHLARRGLPRGLVDLMELVFLVNLDYVQRGEPAGVTCQALRSAAFLSPEGELYPCHVWKRPLGNVRDHDLRELWFAPETLEARHEAETLACGGCFTPCEAYPALAGAPIQTVRATVRRGLRLVHERRGGGSDGPRKRPLPVVPSVQTGRERGTPA